MALYTTLHLHNVPPERENDYSSWHRGDHQQQLQSVRGFLKHERYEVAIHQIMPDIPQPWRFLTIYEFETSTPEIDLPALAPLLANARDHGLISSDNAERIYTYKLFSDWKYSANYQPEHPFSGISVILGNYVAGRYEEYQTWYENTHSVEVSNVPGHVGMKRGELCEVQLEPKHYCPGDQLVLCAQQTDDLLFTIRDFSARARGVSPSGIAMEPRSQAGSFARTVHYFNRVDGATSWPGGIAYDGDLSVYDKE